VNTAGQSLIGAGLVVNVFFDENDTLRLVRPLRLEY